MESCHLNCPLLVRYDYGSALLVLYYFTTLLSPCDNFPNDQAFVSEFKNVLIVIRSRNCSQARGKKCMSLIKTCVSLVALNCIADVPAAL